MVEDTCHCNTVIFWGAGATAELGMLTTARQGDLFVALGKRKPDERFSECLCEFKDKVLGSRFESFCDLLELLDDAEEDEIVTGFRMSGFSCLQLDLIEKYGEDFGCNPDERKNRIIMMRQRYDLAAAMRIIRSQAVAGEFDMSHFVQDVYSMIDANIAAGTGIHIFDDNGESKRSDFIDLTRLRAAKAALIMIVTLAFAASWEGARKGRKTEEYKSFFRWLSELRAEEFCSNGVPVSSARVVSMNFDPIFWWFMKNADEEYNRNPCFTSDGNSPLYLGECIDQVDEVRPMPDVVNGGAVVGDMLHPFAARFVNEHGRRENERCLAKYQTMQIFFPHGSSNIKTCQCCGMSTLYQGNYLEWDSESLFPPYFMKSLSWGAKPVNGLSGASERRSEGEIWKEGELDYIQCRNCGQGIRMCDTEILVQSGLKMSPSWLLQRVAHDIDAEIMKARHIVLLGYSLPPDDSIWIAELMARKQRVKEDVFCSFVSKQSGETNRWLTGDEIDRCLDRYDDGKDFKWNSIRRVVSMFGKDHVRVNLKGFPGMISCKDDLRMLLYPTEWMNGVKQDDK